MGKEALLYEKLPNGKVRCTACARYCEISNNQIGLCGIRGNVDGKLDLFVYGKVIAGHVDPIEKKPVVHYRPGSKVFSIATTGCNWLCKYCQNYDISQRRKVEGVDMTPEEVVKMTLDYGADGIAYTYNQPSIFIEFARDCGVIARKNGLYNIFVSNGYDTPETVNMMDQFLDCITVDFKGSAEPNFTKRYIGVPDPQPIFDTLIEIRDKTNIHVEITDLIVPQAGDSLDYARKLCKFIYDEFGPDIPIHFLRFHPDYKMMEFDQTPVKTLENHHKVAKEEGINYAYIGNVPGHPLEHTYCPECNNIIVKRFGFDIEGWNLDNNNKCKFCGNKIPVIGKLSPNYKKQRFQFVY
ncbi:MAG: AmmeMemoRadiSam system radical SAM enzyme [Nitrosopumilaceae archaeon]|nr:AmmeMemoRadiSam system radical SAM enzyme [Nitrosopumilaceae archaeon]NIU00848.1 AmmeMemoRadiSam system radical SAM enzyme [Nitrosopumilaceae archaeon]NIU87301.1 AmmeMemoRadiSam system radical SAM enzyme [Nitrosopumilaceae archaeon]NIV65829.1 AmmeMemoRadiSam system radical SAM enzyme [Nitrosopumilaceae archaeon]NIX61450.1 AmmeMemoRadiSam system radical SAM enzyme [Nitrosopumilaceae archaeon]